MTIMPMSSAANTMDEKKTFFENMFELVLSYRTSLIFYLYIVLLNKARFGMNLNKKLKTSF